jgi:uncharacterized protein
LKQILVNEFGQATLESIPKRVLVPTFNLHGKNPDGNDQWRAKFFHNYPRTGKDLPDYDGGESIVDVAMRTSAGPTYFPSYRTFVDGGVVANNPSMAAVAQALDPRNGAEKVALADIAVLSLGTGTSLRYLQGTDLDWGDAQWVRPLIELMLDANLDVADFQCRQILGPAYRRLAPSFPPGTVVDLDAVEQVKYLIQVADAQPLDDTVAWLRARW